MKDLVTYINESLANTDINKIVNKLVELFIDKESVLIKKGDKLDLSSKYSIIVPADTISGLHDILNHKYPFDAETHYTGYSGTNTDGLTVNFNGGYISEDPTKRKISNKINKGRLKKLSSPVKKQIDNLIIKYLSSHYQISIYADVNKEPDYISVNDYDIKSGSNMVEALAYYIRNVLGLSVTRVKNMSGHTSRLDIISWMCKESFGNRKITPIEEKIQKAAIKLVPAGVKTKVKKWIYEAIGKSSQNTVKITCTDRDFSINSYGDCNCPYNMSIGLTQWINTELKMNFRMDIDRFNRVKYINVYKK